MSLDLMGLTGDVVTRDSISYEQDRQEYNRNVKKYPLAIVYCYRIEDVIHALAYVRKNGIGLRVRSGGHSYQGYSVNDDILVIDLSRMKQIIVDEKRAIVKVQGGVRQGDLYLYLANRGYTFPGGTCLSVGVSGMTQGGGWGLSTRRYGLIADSLVEAQIVDYKGDVLTVNEEENERLFWAIRGGGGGNFGIIVNMTFKLHQKSDWVTYFEMNYENISLDDQVELYSRLQSMLPTLDRRMNFRVSFSNKVGSKENRQKYILGQNRVHIVGLFYGGKQEAMEILVPLKQVGNQFEMHISYDRFIHAVQGIGSLYPESDRFVASGGFVYRQFTKDEIRELLSIPGKRPIGALNSEIIMLGLGGAVKEIKKEETAFYYRDAEYMLKYSMTWEDDMYANNNMKNYKREYLQFRKFITGAYVNFPYHGIPYYHTNYYGMNLEELKRIKECYDPENIFEFQQSI